MRTCAAVLALVMWLAQAPSFTPAPGSPLEVGPGSGTLLLADVNGDARVDLLSRHLLTRLITVHLGDGRGGFRPAPASSIAFDYQPGEMALGELSGDGIPDLVVTPGDRDLLDVLIGTGTGEFERTKQSPIIVTPEVESLNKRTLHLVDINEDGNLDAVTANGRRRNSFAVMFGDGVGGFSQGPIVELDPGQDGYAFTFGDVNGDGHLDVVNASRGSYDDKGPGWVLVLIGNGKGRFQRSAQSRIAIPPGPRTVTLADLNGDGRIDALIGHTRGLLSVLANEGRGTFTLGTPIKLGRDAWMLRVEDVDRDARPDVVAASVDSVTVLLSSPRGYTHAPGSPFRAGPGAYVVTTGDVNADGRVDIAASSFEGRRVTLLLGR